MSSKLLEICYNSNMKCSINLNYSHSTFKRNYAVMKMYFKKETEFNRIFINNPLDAI